MVKEVLENMEKYMKILFLGDSITDMGKSYNRALDFAISEIKAGGKV